jgi:DNA-binding response OmpR family regulator
MEHDASWGKHMGLILAVEDDTESLDLIETIFERLGHELVRCESAEDVKKQLGQRKPDLALVDIYLPGENGVALTWNLRNLWYDVPIIVMSGYLNNWEMDDILDCGADLVIEKPYEVDEIQKAVATCMRKGRACRKSSRQPPVLPDPSG